MQRNYKCHKCAVASNAVENRYIFKCALKVVSDSPVSRRLKGSLFHARGPAATKDQSPKVLFWRGTVQTRRSADRRDLPWTTERYIRGPWISVRNRQPADSRRRGNPAPSPTVHERRDSPACRPIGYAAVQVTSATATVVEWCVHIAGCMWL